MFRCALGALDGRRCLSSLSPPYRNRNSNKTSDGLSTRTTAASRSSSTIHSSFSSSQSSRRPLFARRETSVPDRECTLTSTSWSSASFFSVVVALEGVVDSSLSHWSDETVLRTFASQSSVSRYLVSLILFVKKTGHLLWWGTRSSFHFLLSHH